ncbi:NSP1 [Rotavirus K]|nr:NSP1 [Rotavirus K]
MSSPMRELFYWANHFHICDESYYPMCKLIMWRRELKGEGWEKGMCLNCFTYDLVTRCNVCGLLHRCQYCLNAKCFMTLAGKHPRVSVFSGEPTKQQLVEAWKKWHTSFSENFDYKKFPYLLKKRNKFPITDHKRDAMGVPFSDQYIKLQLGSFYGANRYVIFGFYNTNRRVDGLFYGRVGITWLSQENIYRYLDLGHHNERFTQNVFKMNTMTYSKTSRPLIDQDFEIKLNFGTVQHDPLDIFFMPPPEDDECTIGTWYRGNIPQSVRLSNFYRFLKHWTIRLCHYDCMPHTKNCVAMRDTYFYNTRLDTWLARDIYWDLENFNYRYSIVSFQNNRICFCRDHRKLYASIKRVITNYEYGNYRVDLSPVIPEGHHLEKRKEIIERKLTEMILEHRNSCLAERLVIP